MDGRYHQSRKGLYPDQSGLGNLPSSVICLQKSRSTVRNISVATVRLGVSTVIGVDIGQRKGEQRENSTQSTGRGGQHPRKLNKIYRRRGPSQVKIRKNLSARCLA